MSQYILAVDGGGTKTDVVCATLDRTVVGKGSSGPTNLTSTSIGAASFNLKEAIRQAIEMLPIDREFGVLAMGLAGMDTPDESAVAHRVFADALIEYRIGKIVLVNDSLIALMNGSDNPNGLVVISGTGSIAFGITAEGSTAKAGGMDYLLADQGSGYEIGLQTLRAAVKSYDGRAEKSILEKLVCEHFAVDSMDALKSQVYNPTLNKIEVAELSQVCMQAFQQGDQAAGVIFDTAVSELIELAGAVVRQLSLSERQADVVLAGAILQQDPVKSKVSEALREQFLLNPIVPETPPVYGAIKLALKNITTA